MSREEFDRLFEAVKNWGRWGADDQLGTLNLVTAERRVAAANARIGVAISEYYPKFSLGALLGSATTISSGRVMSFQYLARRELGQGRVPPAEKVSRLASAAGSCASGRCSAPTTS